MLCGCDCCEDFYRVVQVRHYGLWMVALVLRCEFGAFVFIDSVVRKHVSRDQQLS